jgi:hypothetical protein
MVWSLRLVGIRVGFWMRKLVWRVRSVLFVMVLGSPDDVRGSLGVGRDDPQFNGTGHYGSQAGGQVVADNATGDPRLLESIVEQVHFDLRAGSDFDDIIGTLDHFTIPQDYEHDRNDCLMDCRG